MKGNRWPWLHAALSVSCAVVGWRFSEGFHWSEFSGGTLTGPILALHQIGLQLFVASALLAFSDRRIAIGGAFLGCALALPLYFYLIAPGPFRALFPGNYTDALKEAFSWDAEAVGTIGAMFGLTLVSAFGSRQRPADWRLVESTIAE